MTDHIAAIEAALKAQDEDTESVPGQWAIEPDMFVYEFPRADIAYIAACHPDAIRALLADAKRYRWLRDNNSTWGICEWSEDADCGGWFWDARGASVVDAAIDAAMESK